MKVYISGPMTGQPNNNKALFDEAAKALRKIGYDVVSPVELDPEEVLEGDGFTATDEEYEAYLERDLDVVAGVDAVVMIPGWSKSGGAGREGERAVELGKPLFMWNPDTPSIVVTLPRWLFNQYHVTKRLEKS
jgi:nucleoside 2-deoxyribosyltransferase